METYKLNAEEIELVLSALRYTTEHGYTMLQTVSDDMEYVDMCALIDKLDPKPVKKEGWMVVWPDTNNSIVYKAKDVAEHWSINLRGVAGRVVKVEWEQ